MSIFLEDLKAKALAATPGEWTLRDRGVICGGPVTEYFRGKGQPQIVMCCGGEQIGHEQKTANEHFIAAAYPDAVLQLIDRLEKSEAERDALKAKTSSMMGVGNGPVPAQQVEITGEIPDFTEEETQRLIERLTSLKGEVVKVPIQNDLAVWYGPMPESNGKTNWTAILYRKNSHCLVTSIIPPMATEQARQIIMITNLAKEAAEPIYSKIIDDIRNSNIARNSAWDEVKLLRSELEAVKADRDKFKYCPGVMRCAKCEFQLLKSVINMSSGSVTAGNSDPEKCPNGCGPLWRVSWEEYANQHYEAAEKYFFEAKELRARIEAAEKQEPIGWILEKSGCRAPDDCEDYLEFYESKEVNEEELKNYLTHGRAFQVYASPVPAQQAEVSVPDGWKLVPIKETMDMRGAGFNCCEVTVLKVVEIYAAMIDAAPEPPLHWSDCATNNGPAMEPGECGCGGYPPKEPPCATE